jgi:noranthrone monooxygenase
MPGILSASAPSQIVVKQWADIFRRGKVLVPMIGLASFLGYASLSYGRWRQGLEWKGLLAAGGLAVGVAPYTLIFLQPTNVRLMDLAGGTTKMASDEVVRGLIVKWSSLNLGRSLLPLVGSIVGLWSLLA